MQLILHRITCARHVKGVPVADCFGYMLAAVGSEPIAKLHSHSEALQFRANSIEMDAGRGEAPIEALRFRLL